MEANGVVYRNKQQVSSPYSRLRYLSIDVVNYSCKVQDWVPMYGQTTACMQAFRMYASIVPLQRCPILSSIGGGTGGALGAHAPTKTYVQVKPRPVAAT